MSLLFASTDKVDFGSSSSLDDVANNDGTILVWSRCSSLSGGQTIVRKDSGGFLFTQIGGNGFQFSIARATTSLLVSSAAGFSIVNANSWMFIGTTWNTAGANGDQHLYLGDETHLILEATTYATQRVGSGAVTSQDSLNLLLGNNVAGSLPWLGEHAWIGIWNRQLSLGEIQEQHFRPHMTSGCVLFNYPGFNSTGTQPDWSGNGNAGTVTGTSVSSNPSLMTPFGLGRQPFPYSVLVVNSSQYLTLMGCGS